MKGIICFSVRFCDNSLLVLKMPFQAFSFASKKVQGFFSDRKILMSPLSAPFQQQNNVSVFWNLILAKIYGETFIMSLKSNWFPKELWQKPFISRSKQIKRNLRHSCVDERQLKTIMPKYRFLEYTLYLFALQM